ncbi:SidA/IucD/PvdA family monooxygenase [Streptomyces sp. AHU1]|uniref:SidA/IucD/PvdA family monooxygenase n=1 Tax=Streptomyces sp. AHU1 TaxID=3377215 RepID=UPI0038782CC4
MSHSSTLSPSPADESWTVSGHDGAPLLVIGAGPKAIALAVKSHVLRAVGFDVPEVIAVERDRPAANWCEGRGWTNGRQPLGTLPEKDLGFPYDCAVWGDSQDPVMGELAQRMTGFSWTGHLLDRGGYARWIDRGRPQPSHREWADYLEWAADRVGLRTVIGEVRRAELVDGGWALGVDSGNGQTVVHGCGLVVSGPGPATGVVPTDGDRVLSTGDFWRLTAEGLPGWARRVMVVGAGETAGTIVRELALSLDRDVTVVTPRATVYSRGESPFENRYYSDPTGWAGLTEADRREFIRRTDRAVFSQEVQRELAPAANVTWEPGRVVGTRHTDDGQFVVDLVYAQKQRRLPTDLVVDATGGDPLWFGQILGPRAEGALRAALGGPVTRDGVERAIDASLAVTGLPAPLHLPNLAAFAQGPGFPNLSSLGLLSDRVLAAYTPSAHRESARGRTGRSPATSRTEQTGSRFSLPSTNAGAAHP